MPKAMDYYAVTYAYVSYPGWLHLTEWVRLMARESLSTRIRLLNSPVRKYQILIGKILGDGIYTLLQA